jgi:hypothetical protein
MCLLGDIGGEILWWLCNLPTKIYSAKASEFLTWVRYEDRKRSLLRVLASTPAVTRLLCLELFLSHTLPLNYSYLDLDLVPITVSYRTETGHTLKEDLILTRRASDYTWASVFVKRERDMKTWNNETRDFGGTWSDYLDNTLIDRTKCSANNFLDVVNSIECDRLRNKGNEAQWRIMLLRQVP